MFAVTYAFSGSSAKRVVYKCDHYSYVVTHPKEEALLGDEKSMQSETNLQAGQHLPIYFTERPVNVFKSSRDLYHVFNVKQTIAVGKHSI